MSQKKYLILLLFLFISFNKIFSIEQNENDLNKKYSYKKNSKRKNNTSSKKEKSYSNPYLILKIPPWSKFKDIKKRYQILREKTRAYNTKNSIEFEEYRKAYRLLEEEFENNEYQEKTFLGVLITTIKHIIYYELIMLFLLFVSWFVYTFNKYAALLVVTFVTIDNIIPHWFSTMFTQYIISFILGTIIYFKDFLCAFICNKRIDDSNNNGNIDGVRKRRRFEKIE